MEHGALPNIECPKPQDIEGHGVHDLPVPRLHKPVVNKHWWHTKTVATNFQFLLDFSAFEHTKNVSLDTFGIFNTLFMGFQVGFN